MHILDLQTPASRWRLNVTAGNNNAGRSTTQRVLGKRRAIHSPARQSKERVAGLYFAAIGHDPLDERLLAAARGQGCHPQSAAENFMQKMNRQVTHCLLGSIRSC